MHVEEVLLQLGGWQRGTNSEWDVERAIFPARVCHFLETTQPTLWAEMRGLHAAGLEKLIVGALAKELDLKGALHVLRHGFKFYGKDLPARVFQAGARAQRGTYWRSTAGTTFQSHARYFVIQVSTTPWICYSG